MKAKIAEVFESVQGEGLYLGEKQIFVRFFGCNLSCGYCDTKLDSYTEYEPFELFEEIKLYQDKYHSVSFTGGEPLLQSDFLKEMMKFTYRYGHKNYLETNGTLVQELEKVIDYVDIVAMDFKLPSSTGLFAYWDIHRQFLKVASKKEVFAKIVVCPQTKEEDLNKSLSIINSENKSAILVLQPNSLVAIDLLSEKLENFKNICRNEGVTAFVIPQIHKIAGVR
ncbi:MAG: 7-carboxy-7-deazaguanine synthase QueE [Candidatus Omnitrophica bacterium]|nr:7-carboxy-7-deazaguanine synthase QueE [Candidatus Omnitrophota bacterium]